MFTWKAAVKTMCVCVCARARACVGARARVCIKKLRRNLRVLSTEVVETVAVVVYQTWEAHVAAELLLSLACLQSQPQ